MSEALANNGLDLTNIDALLGAMMDDLDDLPPQGVPPSGHYNLDVSFTIETIGDDNKQVICAKYKVLAINELKDEAERTEVSDGQEFAEFFHTTKKDGKPNVFGIGKLKQRLIPFKEVTGGNTVGDIMQGVKHIAVAASLSRKVNKRNEDQFNMDLKDMIVL